MSTDYAASTCWLPVRRSRKYIDMVGSAHDPVGALERASGLSSRPSWPPPLRIHDMRAWQGFERSSSR